MLSPSFVGVGAARVPNPTRPPVFGNPPPVVVICCVVCAGRFIVASVGYICTLLFVRQGCPRSQVVEANGDWSELCCFVRGGVRGSRVACPPLVK